MTQADLEAFFAEKAQGLLMDRYTAVEVGTDTVCEIWGVAKETVSRYVREGILPPLNPGSSKYRFSLAAVLAENPKYKHF